MKSDSSGFYDEKTTRNNILTIDLNHPIPMDGSASPSSKLISDWFSQRPPDQHSPRLIRKQSDNTAVPVMCTVINTTTTLSEAPSRLFCECSYMRDKLDKVTNPIDISFDPVTIPPNRFNPQASDKRHYLLKSIMIRTGTREAGHWYEYRQRQDGTWEKTSDKTVTQRVDVDEIRTATKENDFKLLYDLAPWGIDP